MSGHRNTKKMTLRLPPAAVRVLRRLAHDWECTVSDVVVAGVEWALNDLDSAKQTAERMKEERLLVSWTRPAPKKKKRA